MAEDERDGESRLADQLRQVNERLLIAGIEAKEQAEREEAARREVERLNADLRAANERLREEDRRKDEFLAMLAHELRNPLGAILGASQLLAHHHANPERLARARDVIDRQARHMARLLDDLLDVSRVARGRVQLKKERLNIADVAEGAAQAAEPLIQSKRHALHFSVPPEAMWVEGDPDRLQQVIGNLLSNAARYTDVGGRIWLTITREGSDAVIRVRDTGIGIHPELLPRVFDLFVQAERSPDRRQGGLGLGLTLARRLTEMHGGCIEAHSGGLEEGSEFTVRLPALAAPGQPARARAPAAPAVRRRILLVDDNADMAGMLAGLLELEGHAVRVALSGPAALELAAASPPDVVLLDIGLPGMDGYEVARRLRALDGVAHARLVALTGYGKEQDRLRSREAGFDAHLTKPVDLDALRRAVAGE
ncbi:MAG: response regulator [Armatimonadetes bacterium]|nr:response regulator [Armatimonadota bacterium]